MVLFKEDSFFKPTNSLSKTSAEEQNSPLPFWAHFLLEPLPTTLPLFLSLLLSLSLFSLYCPNSLGLKSQQENGKVVQNLW